MVESRRTYRVPKRIAESASGALTAARSAGVGMDDISAVTVAQALAANLPVSLDVPRAINEFFSPGWRYDVDKVDQVGFHGGDMGRLWANRCTTSAGAVTAAGAVVEETDDDDDLDEPDEELDEAEFQRLLDYYASFPGGQLPTAEQLPVENEPVVDPDALPDSEYVPADELEEQVATALGLATELDETVEKLADALEDALEPAEDDEEEEDEEAPVPVEDEGALVELAGYYTADELTALADESDDSALVSMPESAESAFTDDEREEARMVRAALAEVIRGGASLSAASKAAPDLDEAAKAAKERMGMSALQRKRSMAMAKMASSRLGLPTTLETDESEPAPEAEAGGEYPKESEGEPHAAHQPRTGQGRFTGVGTRVRDKKGREGYIAGTVGRRSVIQGDDGEVRLMEPEDFEVARKGRAVLRQKPKPVADPATLMRNYLNENAPKDGCPMTVVLEPILALTAAMTLEESKETLEPLFVAIVDPIDTSAVYGVIAIVPTEDGKGWRTFERQYGEWVEEPSWVAEITGLSPPTMVVMDPSTTVDVIEQVDAYDAAHPPEEEEE